MYNNLYARPSTRAPDDRRDGGSDRQRGELSMFEDKTRVLLVVPQEVLDRARVFAGAAWGERGARGRISEAGRSTRLDGQVALLRRPADRDGRGRPHAEPRCAS